MDEGSAELWLAHLYNDATLERIVEWIPNLEDHAYGYLEVEPFFTRAQAPPEMVRLVPFDVLNR